MKGLHANGCIALTGTPVAKNLGDLWSIFYFLKSGLLGQFAPAPRGKPLRITLLVKFLILLAAVLGAANDLPGLAWGYLLYKMVCRPSSS